MNAARATKYPNEVLKLSSFTDAISHPARIAILQTLAAKKECICGDLVTDLPLAQSTVSQHLKVLKDLGLIRGEIDGPKSKYCIDWKVLKKYQKLLRDWSEKMLAYQQDNCC